MRRMGVLSLIVSLLLVGAVAPVAAGTTFIAQLSGAEQVPPVDTDGHGEATVDAVEGTFELTVALLKYMVAAHIHCAPMGVNGPPGVTLFEGGPTSESGLLASGSIAPDVGNACGWLTIADVIAAIKAGNAYVNVHTLRHPAGEVRGQLS